MDLIYGILIWLLILRHVWTLQARKKNLIFIMFDDLRPELSMYGAKHMITPNFKRLAEKSVTFTNAFAQIAVCCPSRVSMLTGLRPDTSGVYNFEKSIGHFPTLTGVLANHSYRTAGYGMTTSLLMLHYIMQMHWSR